MARPAETKRGAACAAPLHSQVRFGRRVRSVPTTFGPVRYELDTRTGPLSTGRPHPLLDAGMATGSLSPADPRRWTWPQRRRDLPSYCQRAKGRSEAEPPPKLDLNDGSHQPPEAVNRVRKIRPRQSKSGLDTSSVVLSRAGFTLVGTALSPRGVGCGSNVSRHAGDRPRAGRTLPARSCDRPGVGRDVAAATRRHGHLPRSAAGRLPRRFPNAGERHPSRSQPVPLEGLSRLCAGRWAGRSARPWRDVEVRW